MSQGKPPPLLIVEDDLALQKQIKWSLDRFEAVTAGDRESALLQFRRHNPAVVTMDLGLPPDPDSVSEGMKLLGALLDLDPDVKVIVLTGQNDQANALRAVALGAYDFFAKPFDPDLLGLTIDRALRLVELQRENRRLQSLHRPDALSGLVTGDAEMLRICRTIEKVAPSDASVLLLGESGTGKEVLAQGLHQASRRGGKFVAINCAAIPENLLESELFGYEKGAFTGAAKTTVGKIETANGGTLMLDEIGDLPLPLQSKLLRFLQERVIERVGGRAEIAIDARVVCATHQQLDDLIAQGRFRQDLYYRLAEIVVEIRRCARAPVTRCCWRRPSCAATPTNSAAARWPSPTMRCRRSKRMAGPATCASCSMRSSASSSWPTATASAATTCACRARPAPAGGEAEPEGSLDLRTIRDRAERAAIVTVLARTNGNIVKAAELLGVSRPTLYDLMRRLAIQ